MDINNMVSIDKLVLVYESEGGELYRQPGADVVSVGTLIDPDTGDDMPLVGFILV